MISYKKYFYLTVFFFCALVFIGDFLYLITGNLLYLTTLFYIGFMSILVRQILIGNTFSLYTFYILTSAFFMYNRFLLGPYLSKNIMTLNYAGAYNFPDWVGEHFVYIATCSIIVVDFVYSFFQVKSKSFDLSLEKRDSFVETDNFFYKKGIIIMTIFIIPLVYKIILQVQYQKSFTSYAIANFTGQNEPSYPLWTKGSGMFFFIGFLMFIYSFPTIKKMKYGYVLFFIMMAFTALKGGRAFFFTYILSIILIFKKIYNKKISIHFFIFFILSCILIAICLGNFRVNMTTKIEKNILADFLYGQTTTMGVPYVFLNNHGELPYKQYPYIFTYLVNPIVSFFDPANQGSLEFLIQSNNYGTVALYTLNPNLYKNGAGLGLNFLTEAYDFFGYFGVFFWSTILAMIIKFVDCIKYTNKNRHSFVFIFFIYQYVLFLPRHTFFGITDHFKYILAFYIVYILLKHRIYIFKLYVGRK